MTHENFERADQPLFIVDDDDSALLRIKQVEQAILKRPQAFYDALSDIKTAENGEPQFGEGRPIDGDVMPWLNEYFNYNYDRSVDFDSQTLKSLNENEEYKTDLEKFRRLGASPKVEEYRQKIRRMRLKHFVGQVILWQNSNQEQEREFPNAS